MSATRLTLATVSLLAFSLISTALGGCREAPASAEDVLTIWAHAGRPAEQAALRGIVERYNAARPAGAPAVAVDFFPDRQYADKVAMAAAGNRLPDILDIDGPFVGPWAAEGLLQSLDPFVSDELRADVLPTVLAQGTYEGKLYALGAFDSALVVYYNRDVIAAAGLDPPEHAADAWSWDEFLDALERVRGHVAVPLALHLDEPGDEWLTYAFAPLVWSAGGRLIDVDAGRVQGVLDGPATVTAVHRWQTLFQRGYAEPAPTNPNPLAAGLAAFDWNGHWMLPVFQDTPGLRFGVMPLPRVGDEPVTGSGSWCWGISRSCRRPAEAWRFIAALLDAEHGIAPMVRANGAVPSRRRALAFFPEYEAMPRRLFREQLEQTARTRPRTEVYLLLTTEFAQALRDVALGSNPQAALTKAAGTVQRALDRMRRRQ